MDLKVSPCVLANRIIAKVHHIAHLKDVHALEQILEAVTRHEHKTLYMLDAAKLPPVPREAVQIRLGEIKD